MLFIAIAVEQTQHGSIGDVQWKFLSFVRDIVLLTCMQKILGWNCSDVDV